MRAGDLKPLAHWNQPPAAGVEAIQADLREITACRRVLTGAAEVYNLAADMGGMGYIETHKTACMLNVLINTHLLLAAQEAGVARHFFASSACVYASDKQLTPDILRCGKLMPIPRCQRTATVGKNLSANGSAATTARTTASSPAWRATTTSTAR